MLLQTPSTVLCSELLHVHIHITIFRKAGKPFSMYQNKCNAVTACGYVHIILDTHVSVWRLMLHGFRVTVFINAFVGIDAVQCVCVFPSLFFNPSLYRSTGSCVCSACCVRLTSGGLCSMAPSRAVTLLTSSGILRSGSFTACLHWLPSVK